jgi:hypothetical protein
MSMQRSRRILMLDFDDRLLLVANDVVQLVALVLDEVSRRHRQLL